MHYIVVNSIISTINIRRLLCQDPDLITQKNTRLSFGLNEKTGGLMFKESSAFTIQRSKTAEEFQRRLWENFHPVKLIWRKLIPLEPRRRKGSLQAAKIAAPAQEVVDPRDPGRIIYPLDIVFCVILLAAMQGKTSCTEIAEFWHQCRPLLSKTFPNFPDEEISHDTVRRITMIIGKDKNAALIERFVEMLRSRLAHPVIAVDGQAVRASRNCLQHSPYVLNIMDADNELILAQEVVGRKEQRNQSSFKTH